MFFEDEGLDQFMEDRLSGGDVFDHLADEATVEELMGPDPYDFDEPPEDHFRDDVDADADALAGAGFGTDEDYGYDGGDDY